MPNAIDREEASAALRAVAATQTAFWAALLELEGILGRELESTDDYELVELEDLIEDDEEEDGEDA